MTDNAHTLAQTLSAIVDPSCIITDESVIQSRSHDFWLLGYQLRLHGVEQSRPLAVVQPHCENDVINLLKFANQQRLSVVPFGAGSGVCGGVLAGEDVIVLDLSAMNNVLDLNGDDLTVTVQSGMLGSDFEAHLNAQGYSMGHFPQSIELSSVGGWVATKASGQYSTKYGGVEQMLVSLRAVLADGTVVETKNVPRSATGPELNALLLGSEGTLAVIVSVTFAIHPLPRCERGVAFAFADFHDGLAAIKGIMRAGLKPALLRLYDAEETKRNYKLKKRQFGFAPNVLLLRCEGIPSIVDAELAECVRLCKTRGTNLGSALVDRWAKERFHIQPIEDLALNKGLVFDTIEVAANWSKVGAVYESVISALRATPGVMAASAHSSHSYGQGTCLYFTFAVRKPQWLARLAVTQLTFGKVRAFTARSSAHPVQALYEGSWRAVIEATLAEGGTISHHHGIGRVRLPWMAEELGNGLKVLEAVKAAIDPNGILNPQALLPGRSSLR